MVQAQASVSCQRMITCVTTEALMVSLQQPDNSVLMACVFQTRYIASFFCAGGPDDPPRGPLELWVADVETGAARPLLQGLNTIFDE